MPLQYKPNCSLHKSAGCLQNVNRWLQFFLQTINRALPSYSFVAISPPGGAIRLNKRGMLIRRVTGGWVWLMISRKSKDEFSQSNNVHTSESRMKLKPLATSTYGIPVYCLDFAQCSDHNQTAQTPFRWRRNWLRQQATSPQRLLLLTVRQPRATLSPAAVNMPHTTRASCHLILFKSMFRLRGLYLRSLYALLCYVMLCQQNRWQF